ncbi:MAG: hypothetical protein NTZ09_14450 [Candidatus Hydrogenedentes bacterium]|nr:hypothetical protein [Candidatus Hydrogenedentota bacterium]
MDFVDKGLEPFFGVEQLNLDAVGAAGDERFVLGEPEVDDFAALCDRPIALRPDKGLVFIDRTNLPDDIVARQKPFKDFVQPADAGAQLLIRR